MIRAQNEQAGALFAPTGHIADAAKKHPDGAASAVSCGANSRDGGDDLRIVGGFSAIGNREIGAADEECVDTLHLSNFLDCFDGFDILDLRDDRHPSRVGPVAGHAFGGVAGRPAASCIAAPAADVVTGAYHLPRLCGRADVRHDHAVRSAIQCV